MSHFQCTITTLNYLLKNRLAWGFLSSGILCGVGWKLSSDIRDHILAPYSMVSQSSFCGLLNPWKFDIHCSETSVRFFVYRLTLDYGLICFRNAGHKCQPTPRNVPEEWRPAIHRRDGSLHTRMTGIVALPLIRENVFV